jgi:hypothetical protein
MHSIKYGMLLAGSAIAVAACSDATGARNGIPSGALAAALSSATLGSGSLTTSFVGSAAAGAGNSDLWVGGGRDASFERGSLMGGGIGDAFLGGIGRGGGHGDDGPFGYGLASCNGTYSASTGRVTCAAQSLPNGLTVNRSVAFKDATGASQQAFDSLTTNTVNTQSSVSGTVTYAAGSDSAGQHGDRRGGYCDGRGARGLLLGDTASILNATTSVASTSDRTVGGLASGSAQRTVNGASKSTESTNGTSSRGTFAATRLAADTTTGLVVPIPTSTSGPTYPTAGTVIRVMQATLTYTGASTASIKRREVVTYDGSATAKIVIVQNDTTRNCTKALPRGPLTCS